MLNKKIKLLGTFVVLSFFLCAKAFSQNQLKSHTHGTSNISIAFENNVLQIQLNAPLMDIVGFEGKPKSVKQKNDLELALAKLTNWKSIFQFYEGLCEEQKVLIKKNHEKTHHDHDHEKHSTEDYSHSEIEVFYEFYCTESKKLSSVKIQLFKKFSRMQKINAQWISDTGQGQKFLDHKQNIITFR